MIKHNSLTVAGMSLLSSMLLLAPAKAAELNLSGLASALSHQGFIVTYQIPSDGRDAASLQAHDRAIVRSLAAAAKVLPARNGRPLVLTKVRDLAAGPALIRAERALDRVESEQLMRALAADPAVAYVEVDQMLQPAWTPNDPALPWQWGLIGTHGINAPAAWDVSRGAGMVIAIVDSGRTAHPDLDANTLAGFDFISSATIAGDGGGRDADPSDPGDFMPGYSSSWHGTHVAGIAAAVTDNATGMAGVAPDAKIVHARVLGRGGGALSDVSDAIIWAAGGNVSGVPANANPAEVINLSLVGSGACGATMQNSINSAVAMGSTVVVAAGNADANVSGFSPANCANVVVVAATTSTGAMSAFSNYGIGVDVTAPGSSIYSTVNSGSTVPASPTYGYYNGTSMAAAHVSGVVALMQSVSPSPLSPVQVATILGNTVTLVPASLTKPSGAGVVNAHHAVLAAARKLHQGITMRGLSADVQHWTAEVPQHAHNLVISSSGDVDMYVRMGAQPTLSTYNCRPVLSSNPKVCSFPLPAAGTYHVMLRSPNPQMPFTGVTLRASWQLLGDESVIPVQPDPHVSGFR